MVFTFHVESNTYQSLLSLKGPSGEDTQPQLLLVDGGILQEELLDCFLHRWNILPVLDPSYWVWRIDGKRVRLAKPVHRLLYLLQLGTKPTISEIRHALFTCDNPLLFEQLFDLTIVTERQRHFLEQNDLSVLRVITGNHDSALSEAVEVLFLIPWEHTLEIAPRALIARIETSLFLEQILSA